MAAGKDTVKSQKGQFRVIFRSVCVYVGVSEPKWQPGKHFILLLLAQQTRETHTHTASITCL